MEHSESISTANGAPSSAAASWSEEIVEFLERIRKNATVLSEYHRKRFYHFKGFSKYFDLPVLVLSVFGSSFSVGTQPSLDQSVISATSCGIGVVVSIITSVKLYLSIESSMQNELKMSKEFYSLSIDIFRVLSLRPGERGENGLSYLQKVFSTYSKLMEGSHLLSKRFKHDHLTPLPGKCSHHSLGTNATDTDSEENWDTITPRFHVAAEEVQLPLKKT